MTIQDTHKKRNATLICMKCKLNAVCEYKMNVIHSSMNLRPCLDWRSLNYAQIVWTILQFHRSMNSWQWKLLVVWARAKRVVRAKRHKHLSMRFSLSPSPSYSNTHIDSLWNARGLHGIQMSPFGTVSMRPHESLRDAVHIPFNCEGCNFITRQPQAYNAPTTPS